jgi:hypothetical protein
VDLVERDAVQLQPSCAGTLALPDDRRKRRDRKDLARHRDVGTLVAECFAEDALALAQPVHLGRVEQRDAHGAGALHDVSRGTSGVVVAVTPLP